jgi:radical SAM protein with 4Fe4S-binding SPASM domain
MILSKHIQVYVKATDTCNLNCSHCYTSGNKGKKVFFNPEVVSDFLIQMTRAHQVESARLLYHGGEPMITPLQSLWQFYELTRNSIQGVSYGIQTNLVYPLTDEKIKFFETVIGEVGMGTSWDAKIRFGSAVPGAAQQQLELWEKNVRLLSEKGFRLTLMVSLSKYLIQNYEPEQIIQYAIDLGFKYILFERITSDGNAAADTHVLPRNLDIDQWILKMYHQSEAKGFNQKIGNMFLEEIALSVVNNMHTANRCRGCETKIITINADGTLAGCPNSAPYKTWGNLSEGYERFLTSSERVGAICKEKMRNPACYTCDVSSVCNGDCYKLKWDGDVCSAPKSLMRLLKNDSQEKEKIREFFI